MKKYQFLIIGLFVLLFFPNIAKADNNLVVNSISVNPANPAKNEPCKVTVTVINEGDDDLTSYLGLSTGDLTTNFKDFTITKTTLPSLPIEVDKSFTYVFEGYFGSVGNKSLYFNININNSLPEAATGNNYIQKYVEIVEPYDYEINSIKFYPSYPAVGEDAMIEVKATNNGFISFTTNQDVGDISYNFPNFEVDTIEWPKVDYDENKITTDEEYYYRYYGKFTSPGKSTYSFNLDSNDRVEEKDETNNNISREYEIYPINNRNLKIEKIEFEPEKPLINEEVKITLTVKNTGKVSVSTKHGLTITEDNTLTPAAKKGFYYELDGANLVSLEKDEYPSLENSLDTGESFKYTIIDKYNVEGTKNLSFEIDKNRQLSEADYSDNATSTSLTIYKNAEERDKFQITDYRVEFVSSTTAKFIWKTDQASTGEVWYKQRGYTSFVGQTLSSSEEKEHSVQIKDLKPGVNYEYTIIAENDTEEQKLTGIYFTMPSNDLPVFTNLSASVNQKAATITWNTNLQSYSEIYYRLAGQGNYLSQKNTNLESAHSSTISNLPDGTYEYYIKASTSVKSESTSELKTFTIFTTTQTTETNTATSTQQTNNQQQNQTQTSTTNAGENTGPISVTNTNLYGNLKGKIILTVEANGEAYYVNPQNQTMNYLGRPADAFNVMRSVGVGITNQNLNQIQIGLTDYVGTDADNDGLSDLLEDAIGTDKTKTDTDSDGYTDKAEIAGGHNPLAGSGAKYSINNTFAKAQAGKIFLQVESKGEAWYINPTDNKRYFLGRPADAFAVMRKLGLGISNANFESLQ